MKKIIVVTGGAGFIGSNLIKYFIENTKFRIISYDNYSSGSKLNHIKNKRINYIKDDTKNIATVLKNYKNDINCIFHFGEFSRIFQSFIKIEKCIDFNSVGSFSVFNFCMREKIKLIYSATSASLGNGGNDKNLSPYAFSKSKNLELLENFKKWYNLKYEIIYFYNVYGPQQIKSGDMATVVGIFEEQFLNKKPLTVVRPGTQSRRFTHIDDTIKVCYEAWKKNDCLHYSISNKKSYSILEVAKMFKQPIMFLPSRSGERHSSALSNNNLSNKVHKKFGKTRLKQYISNFIEQTSLKI